MKKSNVFKKVGYFLFENKKYHYFTTTSWEHNDSFLCTKEEFQIFKRNMTQRHSILKLKFYWNEKEVL